MPSHQSKNDLLAVAVVVVLAMLTTRASAQTQMDDSCLHDSQCQDLLARAQNSSRAKRYKDALRTYQAAYSLSSAPFLQINIGRMQQKLGQKDEAAQSYRSYLATPRQPEDDERRAAAQKYLQEVENERAHLPSAQRPLYKKWWFWTIIGGVTVAAVTGLAIGLSSLPQGPTPPAGYDLYMRTF